MGKKLKPIAGALSGLLAVFLFVSGAWLIVVSWPRLPLHIKHIWYDPDCFPPFNLGSTAHDVPRIPSWAAGIIALVLALALGVLSVRLLRRSKRRIPGQ